MKKDDFMYLLSQAKEDKHGRLYIKGEYGNKVYFGVVTTICEDIFDEHGCEDDEIYDRHWWNDDTFEAHVISKHDLVGERAKKAIGMKKKRKNYDSNND